MREEFVEYDVEVDIAELFALCVCVTLPIDIDFAGGRAAPVAGMVTLLAPIEKEPPDGRLPLDGGAAAWDVEITCGGRGLGLVEDMNPYPERGDVCPLARLPLGLLL